MLFQIIAALLLLAPAAYAQTRCDPCTIADGSYRAVAPPGWNGSDRLPVLVFLPGWRATGDNMVSDPAISGPAAKAGFPADRAGPRRRQLSRSPARRANRATTSRSSARVLYADVRARWPVDQRNVIAGGFSIGGSMVWDLACYAADAFTAFLPFSGGFWEPTPEACTSGPVNLRHVHGRADTLTSCRWPERVIGRSLDAGRHRQGFLRVGRPRIAVPRRRGHASPRGPDSPGSGRACARRPMLQLCLHPLDHGGSQVAGGRAPMGVSAIRGAARPVM